MIGVVQKWNVRTSAMGIAVIMVVVGGFVKSLLDGDPATVPDYDGTIAAITAGIGLLFARDSNVTSEQAGAK